MTLIDTTTLDMVDLGVMTMKEYSILSKYLGLEPHYLMQFSVIFKTPYFGGGSNSSTRDSVSVF